MSESPQVVRSVSYSATVPLCSTCGNRIFYSPARDRWEHEQGSAGHDAQPLVQK